MPKTLCLTMSALPLLWAAPALASTADAAQAGPSAAMASAPQGDSESENTYTDAEIIVTGTPVPTQIFYAPADIEILSGDAKARAETAGFGHTLDELPGIANISTGEQVGLPVIRGLSGNRIRVMTNDIGLYYQQYGSRHPVNIDPFLADRFEIVRGPASLQYGSDAIGGAINIISRPIPTSAAGDTTLHGAARVGLSTAYDSVDGGVSVELAHGPFGLTAALVKRDSGGLRTPDAATYVPGGPLHLPLVAGKIPFTDYAQENLAVGVGYDDGGVKINARYERYATTQNYLVPDPQGPGRPQIAGGLGQSLANDLVQVAAEIPLPFGHVDTRVSYVSNQRRANAGGADPAPLPLRLPASIDLTRNSWTVRSVLHHDRLAGFAGQIGVEYTNEAQFSRGAERLSPGGQIDNIGLFVFEDVELGDLTLNLGGRYDWRTQELRRDRTFNLNGLPTDPALQARDYGHFTWGVGASYAIADPLVFAANIRSGYRAPDLFDLYTRGVHGGVAAIQIGDPNLTVEKALTMDASLRYRSDFLEANITGYNTDFDGFIGLLGTGRTDTATGLPIFQISQRDARLWGFDGEVTLRPLPRVELHGTVEVVRGRFSDNDGVMPSLPSDTIMADVTYTLPDTSWMQSAYISVGVRHAFAKQSAGVVEPFNQYDGPMPGFGTASTDAYTLTHLHAGAQFGPVALRLEADNVFDVRYRDFLDTYKTITLGAGRDIRLSAILRF